jgi:hypothetical protein
VDGIALAPDASRLAVAADERDTEVNPRIQVFTLATGPEKEWEWPGSGCICNSKPIGSVLSWAAGGRTLAFQIGPANGTIEVRLLDTAAPGSNLKSSALAVEWTGGKVVGPHGVVITGTRQDPGNSLLGYNTLISPDGTTIACVTTAEDNTSGVATEFSVSTGAVTGVLGATSFVDGTGGLQDVLWSSPTGSTLIGLGMAGTEAGVLNGDAFTPIPGTSQINANTAW